MIDSLFSGGNYQSTQILMDVALERHKVLAGNLANSETPGYQRMDLDPTFKATLEKLVASGSVTPELGSQIAISPERGLRPTSPDGNNVEVDRELMMINENALRYEALGQFVSGSLTRLKTAITGRT